MQSRFCRIVFCATAAFLALLPLVILAKHSGEQPFKPAPVKWQMPVVRGAGTVEPTPIPEVKTGEDEPVEMPRIKD